MFDQNDGRTMTKTAKRERKREKNMCRRTGGLVTTEVNFLGIILPSAMCTFVLDWKRTAFIAVDLIGTMDVCVLQFAPRTVVDVSTYAVNESINICMDVLCKCFSFSGKDFFFFWMQYYKISAIRTIVSLLLLAGRIENCSRKFHWHEWTYWLLRNL